MTVPNCCENILTDWMCHKVFAVSKYSKLEWSHTVIVVHSTNYQQHRLVTIRRVAFIKNPNCQFLVESKVANMDNCLLYKGEKHINRNTHKPYVSSSLRPLQKKHDTQLCITHNVPCSCADGHSKSRKIA